MLLCLASSATIVGQLLLLLLLAVVDVVRPQQDWTQAQQNCARQCMSTGASCTSAACGFSEVCPAGWGGNLTRRCYGIFTPTTPGFTFAQARAKCQQASGADLTSVHSQAEYAVLQNLIAGTVSPDGKHHSYWLGMQLARDGAATVTGATWADGTAMDFGAPVSGRGQRPWAVGEPVNAGNCVRMMGFGPYQGLWYDADCNQATTLVPTIGYICKGCPAGWTAFNGHCYKAFVAANSLTGTFAQLQRLCTIFNSAMVSIHSRAENDFVYNLTIAANPRTATIALGLQLNRGANGAIQSAVWADGSAVDFGANTANRGVFPWATAGTGFPAQPDNRPAGRPNSCIMMWIDSTVPKTKEPSTWDDVTCGNNNPQPGTVCKF